jgi:hypothetical protein
MKRFLIAAASCALMAGCATLEEAVDRPAPSAAEIVRDGDEWTLTYRLNGDTPVWVMRRSALARRTGKPWRPDQWTVVTPGVLLERRGEHDMLVAESGDVPREVHIRLTPKSALLLADYDPALTYFDGSMVALFAGHFDLFPMGDLAAAEALPADLNGVDVPGEGPMMSFVDRGGPVLFKGERLTEVRTDDDSAYVVFGAIEIGGNEAVAVAADPALPGWITADLNTFTPRALALYRARLEAPKDGRPTIVAAWRGDRPGVQSLGGSVLPGLIAMNFEGAGVAEPTPELTHRLRWFIGHESAHFWLGQTVRYERRRDAWITEGGADLTAVRAMSELEPTFDALGELQTEVDDCVKLADTPVSEAAEHNRHRANYACGAVFAMAAEAAERRATGGDWFDFLKPLIDDNREDGVLTRDEWLSRLTAVAGGAEPRRLIEVLLDEGSADASTVIADLFRATGVAFRVEDGKVLLR